MPEPPCSSGIGHPENAELGELGPHAGGIADGVVLHRAHDLEVGVLGAHAAHHLAEHVLLFGEVEVQHGVSLSQGRHWSPRRAQGLSSEFVGTATRTEQVLHVVGSALVGPVAVSVTSSDTQPQPRRRWSRR